MHLGPGSTVDRYRLVEPAGEGGQGSVWRAEDPLSPGRAVALKLVPLHAAPASAIERFRREAHTLAKLAHPSLPRCYTLFEDLRHELVGISLDFIEGSPLSVLLASESLTREHRVWILRHLAAALAYIHDAGLVHRDVKPQNVMIVKTFADNPGDPAGVKLVDFGIAAERNNPNPITVTGSVIGTNEFLSPEIMDRSFWKEQADGPERDVFALGVLAFALLRGKHPAGLSGDAPLGDYMLAYRKHDGDKHWPPDVDGDPLETFFRKSLALRSSNRAKNGGELAALLGDSAAMSTRTARVSIRQGAKFGDSMLETAESEPVGRPTATTRAAARRSNRLIAGVVAGGSALFAISFGVAYKRPFPASETAKLPTPPALGLGSRPPPDSAEEPPDPREVPKPSPRPGSSNPSGGARAEKTPSPSAETAEPASAPVVLACPAGMAAIAAKPPFCIDKREVSVAEYRSCTACGAAKESYWTGPTATEAARKEQTANCTNTRAGLDNYPINCVSYQDATAYCASVHKRLPHLSEWRAARSSVSLCNEVGGVCPMFEWAGDPTSQAGYRATRGPSFRHATALEGSNIEVARNDDLGFRCAVDVGEAGARQ